LKALAIPFEQELDPRVVDHATNLHEPAPEYAVEPAVEKVQVANHIAAFVALVGHHEHDRVATRGADAALRSEAVSLCWFQRISPEGPKKTARWLLSTP
jgi:hypothetical protein